MKGVLSKVRVSLALAFVLLLILAGFELSYRLYLRLSGKKTIALMKFDELLERSWFQPHPHLIYVFKPKNTFVMTNGYNQGTLTTNAFGFRSTREYDVTSITKAPETLRIAILGGSTTMGVNDDREIWPYLVGRYLSIHYPQKKIEILNEGVMGYTSLDNLIDLAIRVIDFHSDIYIFYLGVNDFIASAPLDIYRTDNSHCRRTLWESLSFSGVELMPDWLLKSKVVTTLLGTLGATDRRDLIANTGTAQFRRHFDLEIEEVDKVNQVIIDTILRNVKSMVGIVKSHDPGALVLLSSFYYLDTPQHIKELNSALHHYARDSGIIFVDAARGIPRREEMVFDQGHFTKEGDEHMAIMFSEAIRSALEGR